MALKSDNTPPKEVPGKSSLDVSQLNQLILDSAGEGIYGIDVDGKVMFVNKAAENMTGFSIQEMIGHSQHELVHHTKPDGSPYPQKECPVYAAFKDGKIHQVSDEVFWRKDGSSFPVEYVSTPIYDNDKRLVGAVAVFKDITERIQIEQEIQRLRHQLELENAYLNEEVRNAEAYGDIVGTSPALDTLLWQIDMVSPTDACVLITGESGTGKELVAREIHKRSSRSKRTMIKVNCASVPKELFESEFFGHVKGAFTGAIKDRAGRFQLANGGTLFLDEIGEVPLDLQSKLLRVLQEGTYEKIGDDKTHHTDVRVIAATNRQLKEEVERNRFRQDLYYRLNVFPMEVPPLRSRKEDIPALASHLLKAASKKLKLPTPRLTQANVQELQKYHWPGNVRELQNVMERALITSKGGKLVLNLHTAPKNIPPRKTAPNEESREGEITILTEEEMKLRDQDNIVRALTQCHWKITGSGGAAELLNMKPSTLNSRIKKWNLNKQG